MGHVRRPRRDQPRVQKAAGLPRISLIDRVATAIELIRTVIVCSWLDGAAALILHPPTPEDDAAVCILRLQFEPDVERIHSAAREEMSDRARPHHNIHTR